MGCCMNMVLAVLIHSLVSLYGQDYWCCAYILVEASPHVGRCGQGMASMSVLVAVHPSCSAGKLCWSDTGPKRPQP